MYALSCVDTADFSADIIQKSADLCSHVRSDTYCKLRNCGLVCGLVCGLMCVLVTKNYSGVPLPASFLHGKNLFIRVDVYRFAILSTFFCRKYSSLEGSALSM
jgi:hypothetical protein